MGSAYIFNNLTQIPSSFTIKYIVRYSLGPNESFLFKLLVFWFLQNGQAYREKYFFV